MLVKEHPEFAEFIMNMRLAAGLSRQQLAHIMHLSVADLDVYERGTALPSNIAIFEERLRNVVKHELRKHRVPSFRIGHRSQEFKRTMKKCLL